MLKTKRDQVDLLDCFRFAAKQDSRAKLVKVAAPLTMRFAAKTKT